MRLRRDDLVVVLSGNCRGQGPAKIVSVNIAEDVVEVEGIGHALKHVKRGHPKSQQGGRVSVPVSIRVSKVALYCPKCVRGVRVSSEFAEGVKRRVCRFCRQFL